MSKPLYHPLRIYFGITLSHLIPPNPYLKRDKVSDKAWGDEFLGGLRDDVEKKLAKEGFDVAYRKHKPIISARRLFAVNFVAAILYNPPEESPAKGKRKNARLKVPTFEAVKKELSTKLNDALRFHYIINDISFEYAAYRTFVFVDQLIATLRIKHVLTEDEIYEANGRIRSAIELLEMQIMDAFSSTGWSGSMKPIRRRPKDGIYEFKLAVESFNSYSETEVCGPLVLLTEDMPAPEAENLCIDTIDPTVGTAQTQKQFTNIVETKLSDREIVEAIVEWMDYDPDVQEIYTQFKY